MKKLVALSLLMVTMLSGCAVYPSGYSYNYVQPSGVVYVGPTYVAPVPNTFIWVDGHRGWYGRPGWGHPGYHR